MILSWFFAQQDFSWSMRTRKKSQGAKSGKLGAWDKFRCSRPRDTPARASPCERMRYHQQVWYRACQRSVGLSCKNGGPQQAQTLNSISKWRSSVFTRFLYHNSAWGEEYRVQYLPLRSISLYDLRRVSSFWHQRSVLCFTLRFIVLQPCFFTSNDFIETLWTTVVKDLEERFCVRGPIPLLLLRQNWWNPPSGDTAVAAFVYRSVSYTPRWNVKCFS